eukprot:TRINITY_DN364_c0_g1_i17.p2 TRINITY_DN364_c0_g1~~TRINITY_DN364_c0_g1_i17.p2  ORF type:complete len:153 (+),score=46.17 TRINITY_DN364_c0_g1_i17:848-1306(+)
MLAMHFVLEEILIDLQLVPRDEARSETLAELSYLPSAVADSKWMEVVAMMKIPPQQKGIGAAVLRLDFVVDFAVDFVVVASKCFGAAVQEFGMDLSMLTLFVQDEDWKMASFLLMLLLLLSANNLYSMLFAVEVDSSLVFDESQSLALIQAD